jgi:hypothetical protein
MARKPKVRSAPEAAERRLRRTNRWKVVRTALQLTVLAALIAYATMAIVRARSVPSDVTPAITAGTGGGNRFIAISYPGLTRSTRLDSKIVNEDAFAEQIQALINSGYVAITQSDIVNYYSDPVSLQIFRSLYCDSLIRPGEEDIGICIDGPYPFERLLTFRNSHGSEKYGIILGENSLVSFSPGNQVYLFPGHLLPHLLGDRFKKINGNSL